MTMSEKAVAEMTMADSVADSMAAMPPWPPCAMTAGESLAGDGERSGGQRESGNRRGNDAS